MIDLSRPLLTLIQDAVPSPAAPPPKVPESNDFWMPLDASVTVRSVDWIYDFLYWMSVISSVLIFGAMIYFIVKYKAKSRAANETPEKSADHSTALEVAWSVLPMFVVIAIFVWGFQGYLDLRTAPKGAMEIRATAQQWNWLFTYPGGMTDDALHVPVNQPVRIVIDATDVLHSLAIPNFRVKMDAVPGRYTDLWFEATRTGEFPVFCTEYCGREHSDMDTRVVVHPPGGFEAWLEEQQAKLLTMPPVELGALLYTKQGCAACHKLDGTSVNAPTWNGLFGKQEPLADGSTVTVDENYLRESIVDPNAKLVRGFGPLMPTYQGRLKDVEIDALIAYIKTLK